MNTKNVLYIDVTDGIPGELPAEQNICFVFLPYLDYKGMEEAEANALGRGYSFMNIPITLPVLDLVKQMEFAGVEISGKLLNDIPRAIRQVVIETLNDYI